MAIERDYLDPRLVDRVCMLKRLLTEAELELWYGDKYSPEVIDYSVVTADRLRAISRATGILPVTIVENGGTIREVLYNGTRFWCHVFTWSDENGN